MIAAPWWQGVRRIGIAVTAVGCCLVALLLAFAALRPEEPLPAPLAAFWDPQSWQVVTVATAWSAALGFFVVAGRTRRQSARPLIAILVMGAIAVTLALVSYLPCTGDGVPFWTPLSWAFAVFVGSAADPFGTVAGCPHAPLALIAARLLAVATVGLGFVAAAAVLFRAQLDVLRMRRSRDRIVVDGPLDITLPAATRIRDRAGRAALIVVRSDANDPPPPAHRQSGIVVLRWSDPVDAALRAFSLRRGKVALTALYLLNPDAGTNLTRLEQLTSHLAGSAATPARDIRAVVRIDDVWVAEYWRRRHVDRPGWALDAIGVYEATAERLVTRWTHDGHDRVAVYGDADLVLAVAAEVAQRDRELAANRSPGLTPPPRIVIVGRDAATLLGQHELHQRAFGNPGSGVSARVPDVESSDARSAFVEALAGACSPALMTASPPGSADVRPAELAATHPDWPVYARMSEPGPLPTGPVMERLYPFAIGFADGGVIDRWERVARVAHANFLVDRGADPAQPARRPWDEGLPDFYKESNIRLVRTTLSSAVAAGMSWGPVPAGAGPHDFRPTGEQLELMAEREHESWRASHVAAGWRPGHHRDDGRRIHPLLVPWPALDESACAQTRRSVLDALDLLRALGYAARPHESQAHTYRRRGEVTAERVDEPWHWTTQSGSVMQADAGDWRVTEGDRTWSVRPAEFDASYQQIEGRRWRRTGSVRARRAEHIETIDSLEGPATATPGDWIVEGTSGEHWVVPAAHFARSYEADP